MLELTKDYLKIKYAKPGNVFLGLLHRLDRPVAGVLLFAKTSKAAGRLSEQIRTRAVRKIYRAWIEGAAPARGKLEHRVDWDEGLRRAVIAESGKTAVLNFTKIREADGRSLVEIELETGRKHQIRAQFAQEKMPIVGDSKYGARSRNEDGGISLVAVSLVFAHPIRSEERICVSLPPDFLNSRGWA